MVADMSSMVTLFPDVAVLDDLELLRNGVLGDERVGPHELVVVPLDGREMPADGAAVQVADAEGVPVAELAVVGPRHVVEGVPNWRARRSARPFEDLHLRPDELDPVDVVVVTDRAVGSADFRGLAASGTVLVVVLASTDGADQDAISIVRSACALADSRPGTRVVVVPLHPQSVRRAEKLERITDAYAHGVGVVDLTGTGPVDEPTEADAGGTVLFFTGLSGSGKSTIARSVRNLLIEEGRTVTFLDGDLVRRHLSAGLGFSAADRDRNVRRIGWVAAEVAGHGGIAICSPIAPYEQTRADVREMVRHRGGRFVLVHVATPLAECERRDRKGLYAKARRGEIPDFTGISAPYEIPESPDLRVDTTDADVGAIRDAVLALLGRHDEGVPNDD